VAKHSDDNTPPNELISQVGKSTSDAGSPPSGGFNANAVNLHLDSGGMGPQGGDDSSDEASATPAPVAAPPPPPPPAWVPPPAPPPAHFDANSEWDHMDTAPKVEAPPPPTAAPVSDSSSDYEKLLSGGASTYTPFKPNEEAKPWRPSEDMTEAAPASQVEATHEPGTSSAIHTDDWMSAFSSDTPAAPVKAVEATPLKAVEATPVEHVEQSWDKTPASYTSPFDQAQKLIDANSYEAPVARASWAPKVEAPSTPATDNPWASAFDEPASPVSVKAHSPAVDNSFKSIFDEPAAAPVSVAASEKAKAKDDEISRMRSLFARNSLLQTKKKGKMVTIKLHRSK